MTIIICLLCYLTNLTLSYLILSYLISSRAVNLQLVLTHVLHDDEGHLGYGCSDGVCGPGRRTGLVSNTTEPLRMGPTSGTIQSSQYIPFSNRS